MQYSMSCTVHRTTLPGCYIYAVQHILYGTSNHTAWLFIYMQYSMSCTVHLTTLPGCYICSTACPVRYIWPHCLAVHINAVQHILYGTSDHTAWLFIYMQYSMSCTVYLTTLPGCSYICSTACPVRYIWPHCQAVIYAVQHVLYSTSDHIAWLFIYMQYSMSCTVYLTTLPCCSYICSTACPVRYIWPHCQAVIYAVQHILYGISDHTAWLFIYMQYSISCIVHLTTLPGCLYICSTAYPVWYIWPHCLAVHIYAVQHVLYGISDHTAWLFIYMQYSMSCTVYLTTLPGCYICSTACPVQYIGPHCLAVHIYMQYSMSCTVYLTTLPGCLYICSTACPVRYIWPHCLAVHIYAVEHVLYGTSDHSARLLYMQYSISCTVYLTTLPGCSYICSTGCPVRYISHCLAVHIYAVEHVLYGTFDHTARLLYMQYSMSCTVHRTTLPGCSYICSTACPVRYIWPHCLDVHIYAVQHVLYYTSDHTARLLYMQYSMSCMVHLTTLPGCYICSTACPVRYIWPHCLDVHIYAVQHVLYSTSDHTAGLFIYMQ